MLSTKPPKSSTKPKNEYRWISFVSSGPSSLVMSMIAPTTAAPARTATMSCWNRLVRKLRSEGFSSTRMFIENRPCSRSSVILLIRRGMRSIIGISCSARRCSSSVIFVPLSFDRTSLLPSRRDTATTSKFGSIVSSAPSTVAIARKAALIGAGTEKR